MQSFRNSSFQYVTDIEILKLFVKSEKKKLDTLLNALTYTNFSQAERENGSNIIWREDKSISVLIMATNSLVFFLQMTLKTLK